MRLPAILSLSLFALLGSCDDEVDGYESPPPTDMRDDPGMRDPGMTDPGMTDPGMRDPDPNRQREPGATGAPTDQQLTERVRQAIRDDADLAAKVQNLEVMASSGAVTITGTVASQEDKDAIGRKLRDLDGVKTLTNDLVVTP